RHGIRERPVEHVKVAVADARRDGPDEHLARARRAELDVLDDERLADGAHDGGSHEWLHVRGSPSSPRRKIIGFQRGAGAPRARFGSRRSTVSSTTRPSRRASQAPRQKWMPHAKATWRSMARRTSSVSGAANWLGSRFADARKGTT